RDGRLGRVWRLVSSDDGTTAVLAELWKGPTSDGRRALGRSNAATSPYELDASKGVVKTHGAFTRAELAQVVYTITQHAMKRATVDGRVYTRKNFEEQTPIIFVESPL